MQDESLETHGPVLAAAGTLAGLGWIGLIVLIFISIPTVFPRWLFFALWLTALTGTAVPFVRLLNRRFSSLAAPPAPGSVILRQSLWVGIFGATCAWLQIGRVLSAPVALLLAFGLGAIEWFLRARELSRKPIQPSDEAVEEE
ncbi:MAG: hypothetical protein HY023_18710 [Chloroflexi bacterium]|nr:hypothetical protein [Chloroflexota bacterium]